MLPALLGPAHQILRTPLFLGLIQSAQKCKGSDQPEQLDWKKNIASNSTGIRCCEKIPDEKWS